MEYVSHVVVKEDSYLYTLNVIKKSSHHLIDNSFNAFLVTKLLFYALNNACSARQNSADYFTL